MEDIGSDAAECDAHHEPRPVGGEHGSSEDRQPSRLDYRRKQRDDECECRRHDFARELASPAICDRPQDNRERGDRDDVERSREEVGACIDSRRIFSDNDRCYAFSSARCQEERQRAERS